MKNDLTEFKNNILFRDIHNNERSDKFRNLLEDAKDYMRRNKKGYFSLSIWLDEGKYLIPIIFAQIAAQIVYHENLILLCNELQKSGYRLQPLVQVEDNHYQEIFQNRIAEGKKILKALRPVILETTQSYTLERKQKDLGDPVIGRFYKNWYIKE